MTRDRNYKTIKADYEIWRILQNVLYVQHIFSYIVFYIKYIVLGF